MYIIFLLLIFVLMIAALQLTLCFNKHILVKLIPLPVAIVLFILYSVLNKPNPLYHGSAIGTSIVFFILMVGIALGWWVYVLILLWNKDGKNKR